MREGVIFRRRLRGIIARLLTEYTRECLALHVARRIRSGDVLDQLYELFLKRGMPQYIRSDNGPEFAAKAVRNWLNRLDVTTLFIEPEALGRTAISSLSTARCGTSF